MVAENDVCYRHANREASVGCQRCDRPICSDCMRSASVGFHCPDCTKSGAQKVYRASDLQSRPVLVMAIIGINVAVFLVQLLAGEGLGPTSGAVFEHGVLYGPFVHDGEWYRIISGGFLHASFLHLGLNMYAIWIFAPLLERAIGPVRTLLIYAGGLVGGSAAVLWFNWSVPTLGASGAALGLAGGMLAILRSRGVPFNQTSLGGVLLLNLALPFVITRISFWGHLGGVAGGLLIGAIIGTLPTRLKQSSTATNMAAVGAIAAMFALAIAGGQAGSL